MRQDQNQNRKFEDFDQILDSNNKRSRQAQNLQDQFYRKNQNQSHSQADLRALNDMVENPNDTFGADNDGNDLNKTAFNMQKSAERKLKSSQEVDTFNQNPPLPDNIFQGQISSVQFGDTPKLSSVLESQISTEQSPKKKVPLILKQERKHKEKINKFKSLTPLSQQLKDGQYSKSGLRINSAQDNSTKSGRNTIMPVRKSPYQGKTMSQTQNIVKKTPIQQSKELVQTSPQKPTPKTKSMVNRNTQNLPLPNSDNATSPLHKLSISKTPSQQPPSKTNTTQQIFPINFNQQKSPRWGNGPQSQRNSKSSSARGQFLTGSNGEPVSFRNYQKEFIEKSRERIKSSNNAIQQDKQKLEIRFSLDRQSQTKKVEDKTLPWSQQLRSGSVSYTSNGASSHRSFGKKNNQRKRMERFEDDEESITPVDLKVNLKDKNSSSNSISNNNIIIDTQEKSIGDPDSQISNGEELPDRQFISIAELSEVNDLQKVIDQQMMSKAESMFDDMYQSSKDKSQNFWQKPPLDQNIGTPQHSIQEDQTKAQIQTEIPLNQFKTQGSENPSVGIFSGRSDDVQIVHANQQVINTQYNSQAKVDQIIPAKNIIEYELQESLNSSRNPNFDTNRSNKNTDQQNSQQAKDDLNTSSASKLRRNRSMRKNANPSKKQQILQEVQNISKFDPDKDSEKSSQNEVYPISERNTEESPCLNKDGNSSTSRKEKKNSCQIRDEEEPTLNVEVQLSEEIINRPSLLSQRSQKQEILNNGFQSKSPLKQKDVKNQEADQHEASEHSYYQELEKIKERLQELQNSSSRDMFSQGQEIEPQTLLNKQHMNREKSPSPRSKLKLQSMASESIAPNESERESLVRIIQTNRQSPQREITDSTPQNSGIEKIELSSRDLEVSPETDPRIISKTTSPEKEDLADKIKLKQKELNELFFKRSQKSQPSNKVFSNPYLNNENLSPKKTPGDKSTQSPQKKKFQPPSLEIESQESLNTFINNQVISHPKTVTNNVNPQSITDPNLRALFEKSQSSKNVEKLMLQNTIISDGQDADDSFGQNQIPDQIHSERADGTENRSQQDDNSSLLPPLDEDSDEIVNTQSASGSPPKRSINQFDNEDIHLSVSPMKNYQPYGHNDSIISANCLPQSPLKPPQPIPQDFLHNQFKTAPSLQIPTNLTTIPQHSRGNSSQKSNKRYSPNIDQDFGENEHEHQPQPPFTSDRQMLEELSDEQESEKDHMWNDEQGEGEGNEESDEPSYAEQNFNAGQVDIVYQNQFNDWKSPMQNAEGDFQQVFKGVQWMNDYQGNAIEPQMSMFDQLTDEEDPKFVNKKMKFMKFNKFGKYNHKMFPKEAIGEDDMGEDMGEDGMLPKGYLVKKNIGRLHQYRERIQVLNEDLNVLIFDGEEDIEHQMEQQMETKKQQQTSKNIIAKKQDDSQNSNQKEKSDTVCIQENDEEDDDEQNYEIENICRQHDFGHKPTSGSGKKHDFINQDINQYQHVFSQQEYNMDMDMFQNCESDGEDDESEVNNNIQVELSEDSQEMEKIGKNDFLQNDQIEHEDNEENNVHDFMDDGRENIVGSSQEELQQYKLEKLLSNNIAVINEEAEFNSNNSDNDSPIRQKTTKNHEPFIASNIVEQNQAQLESEVQQKSLKQLQDDFLKLAEFSKFQQAFNEKNQCTINQLNEDIAQKDETIKKQQEMIELLQKLNYQNQIESPNKS